jgi:hypothetical protein
MAVRMWAVQSCKPSFVGHFMQTACTSLFLCA